MSEGSLEAPIRHPIRWNEPEFLDPDAIDAELRRVFDICHGCRRCFNLCDSFPRLFDLIDDSETMELDSVDSADFKSVVDACTLCDMCFMTKCPYVPPHEFNVDFPHLMLRYRAMEAAGGEVGFAEKELAKTDRNGKLAKPMAGLANWATETSNRLTRPMMEHILKVHRDAVLPEYQGRTLLDEIRAAPLRAEAAPPAAGKKAVIYATCFGNYNNPGIGLALRGILARNGVETEVVHPHCCGMPLLEKGDIAGVAKNAKTVTAALLPYVDKGYEVIALIPSCALMLKFEWPLILPDDADVKRLSEHVSDPSEYIVALAKAHGLADGMKPLDGGVSMHLACHARAQNMGAKSVEMLKLIPDAEVKPIERCSGHGGQWGVMKETFETGLKVGRPVARTALKNDLPYVASECPLAGDHILQGMERIDADKTPARAWHPLELLAHAYGIETGKE